MKVCVVGLGYIGLPTALLLSSYNEVLGVDINSDIISKIKNKTVPFQEPGLEHLLSASDISVSETPQPADAFVICVPTPFDKEIKIADLTFVKQALTSVVPYVKKGNIIIIESTIAPGTCEKAVVPLLEKSGFKVGEDIRLAHCPERAMPGRTLQEMVHNDRIVGAIDKESASLVRLLYSSFVKGNLIVTDLATAEFVKLMENTYRDVTIALANELATIAEDAGINVWEAIALANHHPRVNIPNPGPGVGGHCIAVDPYFLTESATHCALINAARQVNDYMPLYVLRKVMKVTSGIKSPKITVFGVAYKGNVDDTRESPATRFIKLAEKEGFNISIYDPLVTSFEYELSSLDEAITNTDCIVIIADHDEFRALDYAALLQKARHKNVLDTRNIVSKRGNYHLVTLGRGGSSEVAHHPASH